MAGRKDPVVDELRVIRRRISKRLLDAERREGTCVPELRRMGRDAMKGMRKDVRGNGASNGEREKPR
jgi:hypothetical protein